jgi:nitroreductase/NAD-dependent dihydropyrimidine dehydrogenase PreA subunit
MSKITIDPDVCTRCNICIETCPFSIFQQSKNTSIPILENDELCVSCGHCIAICPVHAIAHVKFPQGSIQPVEKNILPSDKQLLELIRSRRSIRAFSSRSVDKKKIEKIVEGACYAPSTNNTQTTQFLVIQNKNILREITNSTVKYLQNTVKIIQNPLLRLLVSIGRSYTMKNAKKRVQDYLKLIDAFEKGNNLITHNAPVLLFFHAENNIAFSDVNADLALQNASLICQTIGLGCFYAGYILTACQNKKNIQNLCSIPKDHQIHGCLAIGYPKYEFNNWIVRKISTIDWL